AFRMVPYIPVYDIMGGWGGNGVGSSGNGTNPLAQLSRAQDDQNITTKIFGNVFVEAYPVKNLVLRSSFGIDYSNNFGKYLTTRFKPGPTVNRTFTRPWRDLFSVFGRVDYAYKDKYLFNATVRRDGSSVFGSLNRYGVFPAFGVGWRISQESFMSGLSSVIS